MGKRAKQARLGAATTAIFEAFPQCFSANPRERKPLKIGIGRELAGLGLVRPWLVFQALDGYVNHPAYWEALARGGPRYGLDGQPAGEVSEKHMAHASAMLPPVRKRPLLRLPARSAEEAAA